MIEYQEPHSSKRIYIKIIAWIVLVVFGWNQITYAAGDLFYFKPTSQPSLRGGADKAIPKDEEIEVTNYDLFHYKQKESGIRKLLPSAKEQEQTSGFSPNYLKRQQNKHEDVIRQKEDTQDLLEALVNRRPRDPVEAEL